MLTSLDASAVRRWCSAAVESISAHRGELDDTNVYPIPDGDTGTNLEATLRSAAEAVAGDRSSGAGAVLRAMARGAVMGARGNSGAIVSQVLCGLAEEWDGLEEAGAAALAAGLSRASESAWAAVSEPVEGTVLSVIRAAAEAAGRLDAPELAEVARVAAQASAQALARTPDQLAELARAGVVDAGGRGLVLLLAELAAVVTGSATAISSASVSGPAIAGGSAGTSQPSGIGPRPGRAVLRQARETGSAEYGYEVQYLLHPAGDEAAAIRRLKAELGGLGDSLVVVGTGAGLFNVHVHVNDVGAAIEAGIEAGRPHRITVVRFDDQIAAEPAADRTGVALVALAPGEGLAELFRAEGVAVVEGDWSDEQAATDAVAEVLAEILGTGAAQVILLPNAAAGSSVAEQAAGRARGQGVSVSVVPTKSPMQGLAGVAVHDPQRRFEDNVIAVAEAAAATRFAEVTVAQHESLTYAGRCRAGDVLGLIDGEVVEIGADVRAMGASLVNRLVAAGGELVTVLSGAEPGADEAAAAVVAEIRSRMPFIEVNSYVGGQPGYPLLIGVE